MADPLQFVPPENRSTASAERASASEPRTGPTHSTPRWRRKLLVLFATILLLLGLVGGYWGWEVYRARQAWREADAAARSRDFPTAAARIERYTALRPDDPAGWFLAARTARRDGRFEDASRFLAKSEKLGMAAQSIKLERDLILIQQGRLGDADRRLRDSVGPDNPDAPFVLEVLARAYLSADRRAEALEACELWHAIEPDNPWPWQWAGLICERMGQTERAEGLYQHAVQLNPDDRDTRVAYARVLVRRRQPAAAAPHLQWVLEQTPDDREAILGFAECLIDLSRPEEAASYINRVLDRDPDLPRALYLKGKMLLPSDPAGAEKSLRRVVEKLPGDAEALYLLVLSLRAQGKSHEAELQAARLDKLRDDLRRLGELLLKINASLEDSAPCHEAGIISLRVGRTQEGVNFLKEALRRRGDHRPTHAALAAYYEKAGSPDLAAYHKQLARLP